MKIAGSSKLLLGATTAIALMLGSFQVANATTGTSPSAPEYSGEELFEGLLLHNGPLAEEHPEVLLDPTFAGAIGDDAADAILTLIEEQHPGAFGDFESGITSGDPYAVRQALYDGRDVLEDVLTVDSGPQGTVTPMADTVCSLTACAVSYVAVAFFLVWAAVIRRPRSEAAFGVAGTPSQTLQLDEWVAEISQQVG